MTWTDATAMAQAVRQKEVSPWELVEDAIKRIDMLNPSLNAVVHKQYEEAREVASQINFCKKPFAGVPI